MGKPNHCMANYSNRWASNMGKPKTGARNTEDETVRALKTGVDQETTLATVMMSHIDDPRLQNKFHCLKRIDANKNVPDAYPLNRSVNQVGRSRRNHIQIKDPQVSVYHLSISVSGNSCVVTDLDSSNGTFINGQRLVGGRVLTDGDEIIIGKTVLRFAARREQSHEMLCESQPAEGRPVARKRGYLSVMAALCCFAAIALVFWGGYVLPDRTAVQGGLTDQKQPDEPSVHPSVRDGDPSEPSMTDSNAAGAAHRPQVSHIQRALSEYTAGHLHSAMRTLNLLTVAKENTSKAFQARRILSQFDLIRQLHGEALHAQEQKAYAKALALWERILGVDMDLIGERPSYYSLQAEQRVQTLSYAYAMDAYRQNNHQKAKQLCRAILQINPMNQEALALLARIDARAGGARF